MKILILNGNNQQESLCGALCTAYHEGAQQAGNEVRVLRLAEMQFDPVLHEGYHVVQPLEPDLIDFQEHVLWAEHIVIVYPTWWGALPAKLKGLFDRSFYSGFAYKYRENSPMWDKLLKGRSAHLITTMDAPYLWYFFAYRSAGTNMLRSAILKFCGISPVKTSFVTRVRFKTREQLGHELRKIQELASRKR